MTTKADFNAEEWSRVIEGPPLAGLLVMAADRGGSIRESLSMGKFYAEERDKHAGGELLDALLADRPEIDQRQFQDKQDLHAKGLARLAETVGLLEQKAEPDEVDAYKSFVLGMATRAAQARKEGGFLGIGGKEVSDQERTALNEIAAALKTDPPSV